MFNQQKIVIESGEGNNHFKAEANLDTLTATMAVTTIMANLRAMQQDRMAWAEKQKERGQS